MQNLEPILIFITVRRQSGMIDRLAHRLDEVGELTGEQIDAILLEG